jgi:hypothetical protein
VLAVQVRDGLEGVDGDEDVARVRVDVIVHVALLEVPENAGLMEVV